MNDFLNTFLKIRSGFRTRIKFIFILDLVSIFSVLYSIFIILNVEFFLKKSSLDLPLPAKYIPPVAAFIVALIGSILIHRKDAKINIIPLIETKYVQLNERLRTAYDNRDQTNIVVNSLKNHVSELLSDVLPSQLLSTGKITFKILVAILFISGTAWISMNPEKYSIDPGIITDTFNNVSNTITGNNSGPVEVIGRPEMTDKIGTKGGGDIFSKPKIASIEGKNIDLTLYSGMGTGFDVRDASETKNQFIQSAAYPVDILGSNVSDGGYSILMKKTETEKELINKYAIERSKI